MGPGSCRTGYESAGDGAQRGPRPAGGLVGDVVELGHPAAERANFLLPRPTETWRSGTAGQSRSTSTATDRTTRSASTPARRDRLPTTGHAWVGGEPGWARTGNAVGRWGR